jgi:hypothetical protein
MERVVQGFETLGTDMVNNWNTQTIIEMLQLLKTYVEQSDESVKTNLTNYIDTALNQVNSAISNLQSELDEVRTLAEILSDAEKGQLEEILNNVFKKISQEGLLNRLCLALPDGTKVSLSDLLIKIATRPEIKSVEYVYDETGKEIISVKVTLTDGYNDRVEIFDREVQDVTDDEGNLIGRLYTFKNNPQDGYYQLITQVKTAIQKINWINKTYEIWKILKKTKPVITLNFEACPYTDTVDEAIDQATDINQDGVIGDTTTAETSSDTTSSDSTTTSSDSTVTGSDI